MQVVSRTIPYNKRDIVTDSERALRDRYGNSRLDGAAYASNVLKTWNADQPITFANTESR